METVKYKTAIGNDANEFTYPTRIPNYTTEKAAPRKKPHDHVDSKMTGCRLIPRSNKHMIVDKFIMKRLIQKKRNPHNDTNGDSKIQDSVWQRRK